MVKVLIFGHALREAVGEPEFEFECAAPISVQAFLDANQALLGSLSPFIVQHEVLVTINKKVGSLESIIRAGDTLKLTHQINQAFDGARWQNP